MNYPKDFVTSSLVSVLLLSGVIVFDKDPLDLITLPLCLIKVTIAGCHTNVLSFDYDVLLRDVCRPLYIFSVSLSRALPCKRRAKAGSSSN